MARRPIPRRLTERITIPMTPAMLRQIEEQADARQVPRAEMIRDLIQVGLTDAEVPA